MVQDYIAATRFRPYVIDVLQTDAEDYLFKIFQESSLINIQAKRQTISVRYLQLSRRIHGETD